MSIGICRVQKIGAPKDIAGIQIHNRREREHSNTNPDIDRTRSAQNYTMSVMTSDYFKDGLAFQTHDGIQGSEKPYNALIDERIKQGYTGKKAVRKDAVRCCEVLFTASGDFFEQHPEQTKKFFRACLAFAAKRFGVDNIIAATVHMDEDTPHMHLDFVPLTADGRLSAKSVLGGRKEMQQLQDDFFEQVGKQFGLERGNRADLADPDAEQPRKHLTTRQLKAETAAQLAEQEQQIEKQSSRLSSYGEQLQEMETLLDQAERAYHKALAGRTHAENDAMLAEERAKQADTRAESVEARLHAAETKLNEVNAQYDAAAQELGKVLEKKARASEIHKLSNIFGETVEYHKNMLDSTRAIGNETYDRLREVKQTLDETKALEARVKSMQEQIEPLHQQALVDRDAAERLRKEQEQEIERRAAELTSKRIKEMFGSSPSKRSERLERFCDSLKFKDGKTALEVFEEQEKQFREQGQKFSR